jgi:hypothetical protein
LTDTTQHDERGALISDHPHPRPALRGLTAILVTAGLIGDVAGVIGLVVMSVILDLPLLPLAAFFLAMLCPPLILLAVLHPHVTAYERGLWIRPMIGRGNWVPWDAVTRIAAHTLIQRGVTKEGEREHFGQLIVADSGLTWPFLVVGIMAGLGRVRAFGISTHGQRDYAALHRTIKRYTRLRSER